MNTPERFTASYLVPENLQNRLIYLQQISTAASWEKGDIANQIWEIVLANGWDVMKKRVYEAVGEFCGDSARTVRYYAAAAAFYAPAVREAYAVLPFSHFVFAMSFPGAAEDGREMWQVVLDRALDFIDQYHRPPSVEALGQIFARENGPARDPLTGLPAAEPDNSVWEARATDGVDQALIDQLFPPDAGLDPRVRTRLMFTQTSRLLGALSATLAAWGEIEPALGVPGDLQRRTAQLVVNARRLYEELEPYVDTPQADPAGYDYAGH